MYTIPHKKMIIINIIYILKKYTDMDHRLTQAEIVDILKKEYMMDVDRKTVKRNIMNLLEMGLDIEYTEINNTKCLIITAESEISGYKYFMLEEPYRLILDVKNSKFKMDK